MNLPLSMGALKTTLAYSMNVPERSVAYPHRVAQEHGLVSKGRRGRGGSVPSIRDAAFTIAAIACAHVAREVVEGLQAVNEMRVNHTANNLLLGSGEALTQDGWNQVDGSAAQPWKFTGFDVPALQNLSAGHGFIEALIALIEAARDDAFGLAQRSFSPDDPQCAHFIKVAFFGPDLGASIEIKMVGSTRSIPYSYDEIAQYFSAASLAREWDNPFQIVAEIDWRVIYAVAKLFRDEERG